ncbi:MAG: YkgJ family cysteine cluster protein [Symbiobacteriaceae bacterium]|nr:YkgJ family cysteine cluster protein [Symbiobacteriaceae bacterium]
MLQPGEVAAAAAKKQKQNSRFINYLKSFPTADDVDRRISRLHWQLFAEYQCTNCANCCRVYNVALNNEDIFRLAELHDMPLQAFVDEFLVWDEQSSEYEIPPPCKFLQENNACSIYPHRPQTCIDYPYTQRPDRVFHLHSLMSIAEVCPIAYELVERLKKDYQFK